MRMGKGFKAAAILGVLSPLYMGSASAQLPAAMTFTDWTQDAAGTISDTCPSGFSCEVIASGPGFLQMSIAPTGAVGGDAFIKTIVSEAGTAGAAGGQPFFDVSFTRMSMNLGSDAQTNVNGIVGMQHISDNSQSTAFTSDTSIRTGWGQETGAPSIEISQQLEEFGATANVGDDFLSAFNYKSDLDPVSGARTGFEMEIDQVAGLAQGVGSTTDVQVFTLREFQGTRMPGSGTVTLPNLDSTGAAQTLSYGPNDDVKAIWIGQSVDLSSTTAGGGTPMGSLFGYQSYENVGDTTQTANPISYFSLFQAGPWTWSPDMGATPCMSDSNGNPNPSGLDAVGATVCPGL